MSTTTHRPSLPDLFSKDATAPLVQRRTHSITGAQPVSQHTASNGLVDTVPQTTTKAELLGQHLMGLPIANNSSIHRKRLPQQGGDLNAFTQ
jgi:hypothetical protein